MTRFAAILSGGVGERFWPASTPERPKQLLPLLGDRTLLRETFDRLLPLFPPDHVLFVTSARLVSAVTRECPEIPRQNVIGEPRPLNTTAAVGVAACAALARGGERAALAVLPADHAVRDRASFREALTRAFEVAEGEAGIVTLGIRPDRPETSYGYVTRGEPLSGGAFRIAAFHEKPDAAKAAQLLREGKSYWNAGMFIALARTLLAEIGRHAPEVGERLDALVESGELREGSGDGEAFRELYARAPAVSFDTAVMEHTGSGAVLPADIGWDDVGSWEAMARLLEADAGGNVVHGAGRLAQARDNILFADGGRITVIGASNLVVVLSGAETFVCTREKLADVKELLRRLNGGSDEAGGKAERR